MEIKTNWADFPIKISSFISVCVFEQQCEAWKEWACFAFILFYISVSSLMNPPSFYNLISSNLTSVTNPAGVSTCCGCVTGPVVPHEAQLVSKLQLIKYRNVTYEESNIII